MPRVGRVVLPDYPHHVVHRGHNRQVIFGQEADFRLYLDNVRELKAAFGIQVYAYCLGQETPLGEMALIRSALKRGQLTGNARFADQVEQIIGRRVDTRGPVRPAKTGGERGK